MGTNYFARIIPSIEQKKNLINLINDDKWHEINEEVSKMYNSPQYDFKTNSYTGGEIHLGKRSYGWKFLWNPNWYKINNGHCEWEEIEPGHKISHWIKDPYSVQKYYDLNKESIKAFINRDDIKVYDEYNEEQDKNEFWNMAINWTTWVDRDTGKEREAWDGKSYELWEKDQNSNWKSFNYYNEYCTFMKEQGFIVEWPYTDFYSDGLRFATSIEFG